MYSLLRNSLIVTNDNERYQLDYISKYFDQVMIIEKFHVIIRKEFGEYSDRKQCLVQMVTKSNKTRLESKILYPNYSDLKYFPNSAFIDQKHIDYFLTDCSGRLRKDLDLIVSIDFENVTVKIMKDAHFNKVYGTTMYINAFKSFYRKLARTI